MRQGKYTMHEGQEVLHRVGVSGGAQEKMFVHKAMILSDVSVNPERNNISFC